MEKPAAETVSRSSSGPPRPARVLTSSNFEPIDGSVIGSDLSIEGQAVTIKGSLRVNGHMQAELHCGELLVGEQALIVGSIVAERVVVSGRAREHAGRDDPNTRSAPIRAPSARGASY